jgi:hypothetical protein
MKLFRSEALLGGGFLYYHLAERTQIQADGQR